MLDIIFLAVSIYVLYHAEKGEYKETACNIALVVGIIAGFAGCVYAFFKNEGVFAGLNVIVMLLAFGLRFAARWFVKLYNDKRQADIDAIEHDLYLHSRFDDPNKPPVYTDETFDDEELRFGKGGWTDNKL